MHRIIAAAKPRRLHRIRMARDFGLHAMALSRHTFIIETHQQFYAAIAGALAQAAGLYPANGR